jgi:hypothetical protein
MQLIASYPIQAEACLPHCGSPVLALTQNGDTVVGILDGVRDGHLYLKPLEGYPQAQTLQMKQKAKQISKGKMKSSGKRKVSPKANTLAFGYGGFGYGGFRFGLGAGLGFAIPLFLLASLFAFPFFI